MITNMMTQSQLDVIFPRWVYRRDMALRPEFLQLADYLYQNRTSNQHNMISQDSQVLDHPQSQQQRQLILDGLQELNQHYLQGQAELSITQSWINWNHPNERHHRHRHANSIISGTLYLGTGSSTAIRFYDSAAPQQHWDLWRSLYTDTHRDVKVQQGTLLMWFSMIEHEVLPDTSTDRRTSLSFNTWIKALPVGNQQGKTLIPARAAS